MLNFAESKCLHLTAYVIKVLLVGCFSVNDAEGLCTSLQRKISSTSKEEEDTLDVSPMLRRKSSTVIQEEKVYQSENLNELIKVLELTETHKLLENLNKE